MIDIIKELGDSRRYNFHSHTEFCDGRAQMEAFAREVVKRGFTHYGFTPHSPVPIESPCNMTRGHVADYDREFYRIRDAYGDSCCFYRGMEIDYLGKHWGAANDYFASLDLDYSIGSVHFIPDQSGNLIDVDGRFPAFKEKMARYFGDDIRYVVEKFYEHSIRMVEEGGFDIVGHLDKIGYNASQYFPGIENESWYLALVNELIDKIIAAGYIVEINTKIAADAGRFFPGRQYWKRLVDGGVKILVNSDAHVPALVDAGRDMAFSILDELK